MKLIGKQIVSLLDDEFEDLELWYPVYRSREEGATVLFTRPRAIASGKLCKESSGLTGKCFGNQTMAPVFSTNQQLASSQKWHLDKLSKIYPRCLKLVRELDQANKPMDKYLTQAGYLFLLKF